MILGVMLASTDGTARARQMSRGLVGRFEGRVAAHRRRCPYPDGSVARQAPLPCPDGHPHHDAPGDHLGNDRNEHGDGYGSCTSWLTARAGETKGAARAQVRQMRRLSARPDLEAALGRAPLTESQVGDIAEWTRQLPEDLRAATDKVLVQAAEARAGTEDLAVIASAAIEQWRRRQPDPDQDESRFGDRSLRLGVTFGGAALLRGEPTPECAAAVRAVFEALGKKRGAEDDLSGAQRFHDALQEASELLLRARLGDDGAMAGTGKSWPATDHRAGPAPTRPELKRRRRHRLLGQLAEHVYAEAVPEHSGFLSELP